MSQFTVAVSEATFQRLFDNLRDKLRGRTTDHKDLGPFSVAWDVGFRLSGGSIELQSNGTARLSELDIVYDPFTLTFGVDLPEICVGGFCIIPKPWGGCALSAPRICVFDSNPDISLPLNLNGLLQSELSGAFQIDPKYVVDPNRTPVMTDLDAEDANIPNQWRFILNPSWLDIDLIDIADTVGNILDRLIENVVDGILGWLPQWARDLIKAILGPVVQLVRRILDIGDDIQEWLSNLLGVSIGLFNIIVTIVVDLLKDRFPLLSIEDPYPILDYENGLIPVKLPLRNVSVAVNDDEMILGADVGG